MRWMKMEEGDEVMVLAFEHIKIDKKIESCRARRRRRG
jgi:hypothetical protein